jgi:hypothetical protein
MNTSIQENAIPMPNFSLLLSKNKNKFLFSSLWVACQTTNQNKANQQEPGGSDVQCYKNKIDYTDNRNDVDLCWVASL